MVRIETERLILKELQLKDEEFVYQLFTEPLILKSYANPPISFHEDAKPFIRKIKTDGNLVWKIIQKQNNKAIGIAALHHWENQKRTIEIGGTLIPACWGHGIMSEAFTAMIDYSQHHLYVKFIIGRTQIDNIKAQRLVQKLGFAILSKNLDCNELTLIKQLNND